MANGFPTTPKANGDNGRDELGRFTKGNPGGPGNPFTRQVAGLRKALFEAISEEDVQELACMLLDRARQGDLGAAKLLWLYTLGRPGAVVDPDTLDLHEWQVFQQTPTDGKQLETVLGAMPIQLACQILRAALPALKQAQGQKMSAKLDRQEERLQKRRRTQA